MTSVSINNIEKDTFLKVNKMVFSFAEEQSKVKEDFIYDGKRAYLNVVRKYERHKMPDGARNLEDSLRQSHEMNNRSITANVIWLD